jgi:hypothetical protein
MKKLFLLLVTTFLLIGCTADDETIYDYIGTWSGTYTGSDKGVWNFVVASDGDVTGTMHSETNNENYTITGHLEDSGELFANLGVPEEIGQFAGTLNLEKKASGNWMRGVPAPIKNGNWTGEKTK